VDPDFLRPDGDYRSWYVRDVTRGIYLRGFEHWDEVEGAMIGYVLRGPAYWLGATDLGVSVPGTGSESESARSVHRPADLFRITSTGSALLGQLRARTPTWTAPTIKVLSDFRILAPHGTSCFDRFRLAFFAEWQASRPDYQYLITQQSLQRAVERGISPRRILAFLRIASSAAVPATVARHLTQSED
jgi:hypothetical protein